MSRSMFVLLLRSAVGEAIAFSLLSFDVFDRELAVLGSLFDSSAIKELELAFMNS